MYIMFVFHSCNCALHYVVLNFSLLGLKSKLILIANNFCSFLLNLQIPIERNYFKMVLICKNKRLETEQLLLNILNPNRITTQNKRQSTLHRNFKTPAEIIIASYHSMSVRRLNSKELIRALEQELKL